MLKKFSLISTVLLLCLATNASAMLFWGNGGTDSLWYTTGNWYESSAANPDAGTGWDINHAPPDTNTLNIGIGGRDRKYPVDLYNRAQGTPKMTDPTINVNLMGTPAHSIYAGGASGYAAMTGYVDPNVYHFLWINNGVTVRTGNLTIGMASTSGKNTVYIGDNCYFFSAGEINLSKRGGNGELFIGANSVVDVNGMFQTPLCPGNNGITTNAQGRPAKGRVWLAQNAMLTFYDVNIWHTSATINNSGDTYGHGQVITGDGKVNLEQGAKLRLRRGSVPHYSGAAQLAAVRTATTGSAGWPALKRFVDEHIDEGRITAFASLNGGVGLTNGQLIPGFACRGVSISAVAYETDPCIGKWYYEVSASTTEAGRASLPIPVDGAVPPTFTGLSWQPPCGSGTGIINYKVYYDANEAKVAARDPSVLLATLPGTVTSYDPGVNTVYGATSYWAVDAIYDNDTIFGSVWNFTLNYGGTANHLPADGATGLFPTQTLTWRPGLGSTATNLYISSGPTGFADVNNRTVTPIVLGTGVGSYNMGNIALNTTYYWAADAVNPTGTIADTLTRDFRTAAMIMVDNFRSYANTTALKAVWTDSSGTTTASKSSVGVDDVNSMQVIYNCYGQFGDVKANMTYRTDAFSVSVRVRGAVTNVEPIELSLGVYAGTTYYEKLIPVADVNVKVASWQEARVAFSELTGLNPADITKVVIGFGSRSSPGNNNAAGTVLIDSVAMYPRRCLEANVLPEDFTGNCLVTMDDLEVFTNNWLVAKTTPAAPTAQELLYLPLDETDPCTYALDPVRGWKFTERGGIPGWDPNGAVNGCYTMPHTGSKLQVDDNWFPPINGTNTQARDIFRPALAGNQITISWYWRYNPDYIRSFVFQTAWYNTYTGGTFDNVLTARVTAGTGGYAFWWGRSVDPNGTSRDAQIALAPINWPVDNIIGQWVHWAMVKDGPNGIGRVYEDGTLIREIDTSGQPSNTMAYPFGVQDIAEICSFAVGGACQNFNFSGSPNCSLDEFRIYGGALTEAEIKYLLGNDTEFFPGDANDQNLFENGDKIINFKDYSNFADNYLDDTLWP